MNEGRKEGYTNPLREGQGSPLCVVTEARLGRYLMRGTGILFHFSEPNTDNGSGIYSVKGCWMNG